MRIYASHPVFPVPDIRKTAEYYEDKLGFRRVDYLDVQYPHVCLYRDGIEVILTESTKADSVISNTEQYGYGEDVYIIVSDQAALEAEFRAAGVEIVEPLHMTDYHNYEFTIRDIDGRRLVFGMKAWNESDDHIWEELYSRAKSVIRPRDISPTVRIGEVGAAVITREGNIYTGICMDTASSLGMCAERNAISTMLTHGETEIVKLAAVMEDGSIGAPCGACREFMMQLSKDSANIEILIDYPEVKTVRLGELLPMWWA